VLLRPPAVSILASRRETSLLLFCVFSAAARVSFESSKRKISC